MISAATLLRSSSTRSLTPSINLIQVRCMGKGKDQGTAAPAAPAAAKKTTPPPPAAAAPSSSTRTPAERASARNVELPTKLYGVHSRYANALYMAAARADSLKAVEEDFKTIRSWIKSNKSFATYLHNPVIRKSDKVADIEKISKGMNDTTRGFLGVLASNARLGDLEKVLSKFDTLMNARNGIVEAVVTSAEPLSADKLKKVEATVSNSYLEKNQRLKLTAKVDPSILGGLQVKIGSQFIDLSVSSKVSKYEKILSASVQE